MSSAITRASIAFENLKNQQLKPISADQILDLVRFLTSFDILAKVRRWCEYHAYLEAVEDVAHSFVPNPANHQRKKGNSSGMKEFGAFPKKAAVARSDKYSDEALLYNNQNQHGDGEEQLASASSLAKRLTPEQLEKIKTVIQQSAKLVLGPMHINNMINEDEEIRSAADAARSLQQVDNQSLSVQISPLSSLGGVILKYCERYPLSERKWVTEFQIKTITAKKIDSKVLLERIKEAIEGDVLDVKFCDPEERNRRKNPMQFASESIVDQAKRRSASPDFALYLEEFKKAEEEERRHKKKQNRGSMKRRRSSMKGRKSDDDNDADENSDFDDDQSTGRRKEQKRKSLFFQKHQSVYAPPTALTSILTPLPTAENLAKTVALMEADALGSKNNNNKTSSTSTHQNRGQDAELHEQQTSTTTDTNTNDKYRIHTPEELKLIKSAVEQLIPVLFQLIDAKGQGVISLEQLSDFCAAIILSTEQAQALQVDMLPAYKLRNAEFSAFATRHSKIVPDVLMQEKVISFLGIPENVSTSPMAHVTCVPERLVAPVSNNKLRKDFEDSMLDKKVRYLLLSQKQQELEKKNREMKLAEEASSSYSGFSKNNNNNNNKDSLRKNRRSSSKGGGGVIGSIQHAKEVLQNEMDPSKATATQRIFGEEIVDRQDYKGFIGVDIVFLHDIGLYACSNTVGEIYFFTADARSQIVCSTPRCPSSITALATCRNLYQGQYAQKKQLLVACDRTGRVMFWEIERVNVNETTVTSKRVQVLNHPVRFAWIHEKNFVLVLISGENQVTLLDLRKFVLGLDHQQNLQHQHQQQLSATTNSSPSVLGNQSFMNNVAAQAISKFASNIMIGSFPTRAVITTAALSSPLNALFICGALDGPELIPLGCVAGEMPTTPTPLIASPVNPNQQTQNQQKEPSGLNKTGTTAMNILHDLQASQKKAILSCCCDPQLPQGLSVDAKLTVTVWDLRRMTPTQCVTVNVPDVFFHPKIFSICVAKGRRRCALLTDGAHALWFERPVDQRTLTVTFGNEAYEVVDDENDEDHKNNGRNNNNNNDQNGGDDGGEKQEDLFDDDEAVAREADAAAPVVALFEYNRMILVVTERTVSLWRNESEAPDDEDNDDENDQVALMSSSLKFSTSSSKKNLDSSTTNKNKFSLTDEDINEKLSASKKEKTNNTSDDEKDDKNQKMSILEKIRKQTREAEEEQERKKIMSMEENTAGASKKKKTRSNLPVFSLEVDRSLDNSCRKLYIASGSNHISNKAQNKQSVNNKNNNNKWTMVTRGTLPNQCTVHTAAFNSQRLVVSSSASSSSKSKNNDNNGGASAATYPCSGRAHLALALTNGDLIFVHPVTVVVLHTIRNIFSADNLSPPHDSWNSAVPPFVSVEERELELEQERTSKMLAHQKKSEQDMIDDDNNNNNNKFENGNDKFAASASPLISSICFIGEHDVAVCQEATGTIVVIQDYFLPQSSSRWNVRRVGTKMVSCNAAGGDGHQDQLPFSATTTRAVFSTTCANPTIDICLFSTKFSYFWPVSVISLKKEALGLAVVPNRTDDEGNNDLGDNKDTKDDNNNSNSDQDRVVAFLTNPLLVHYPLPPKNNDQLLKVKTTREQEQKERRKKKLEKKKEKEKNSRRNSTAVGARRRSSVVLPPIAASVAPQIEDEDEDDVISQVSSSDARSALSSSSSSDSSDNDEPTDAADEKLQVQHPRRAVLVLARKVVILDVPNAVPKNSQSKKNSSQAKYVFSEKDTLVASFDTCFPWRKFEDPPSNTVAILETVKMIDENDSSSCEDEQEAEDHVILFLGRSDGTLSVYDLTDFFVASSVATKVNTSSDNNLHHHHHSPASEEEERKITLISRYRLTRRSLRRLLFPTCASSPLPLRQQQRTSLVILDDSKVVVKIPLERILRPPPLDIGTSFDVPYEDFLSKDGFQEADSRRSSWINNNQKRRRRRSRIMTGGDGGSDVSNSLFSSKHQSGVVGGGRRRSTTIVSIVPSAQHEEAQKKNNNHEIGDDDKQEEHLDELKPDYSAFEASPTEEEEEEEKQQENNETVDVMSPDPRLPPLVSASPSLLQDEREKRSSVAQRLRSTVAEQQQLQQIPSSNMLPIMNNNNINANRAKTPSLSVQNHHLSRGTPEPTRISSSHHLRSNTNTNITQKTTSSSVSRLREHLLVSSGIRSNNNNNSDRPLRSISPMSKTPDQQKRTSPVNEQRSTAANNYDDEEANNNNAASKVQVASFLRAAEETGSYTSTTKQRLKNQQMSSSLGQHQRRPSTPMTSMEQQQLPDVDKRFVEPSGGKMIKKPLISQTLLGLYKRKLL